MIRLIVEYRLSVAAERFHLARAYYDAEPTWARLEAMRVLRARLDRWQTIAGWMDRRRGTRAHPLGQDGDDA